MKYKSLFLIVSIFGMLFVIPSKSVASEWKQDEVGWWYDYGNGRYPVLKWEWIDGNKDGIAECYYFNQNGYILADTITPDGYLVNVDGAWIENGFVQTKNISDKIKIDMGDFIINLPSLWNEHYYIYAAQNGWHWEVNFSPVHEYPQTLFQIARFKTQKELNDILDFVSNNIPLGYHNGYYYLFCSPTDTALEFYSEDERELIFEMLEDYNTIASNIEFK